MRNPHATLQIIAADRRHAVGWDSTGRAIPAECDSMVCRHCNAVTFVRPKEKPEDIGGLCKVCMGLICPACVGQPCTPLQRRLEAAEASYHARRSYGI